ncbi:MAG TPA: acyl-CoA dehydrogenase family protein [Eoetvoesiella sp.]
MSRIDMNTLSNEDFRTTWRTWIEANYTSPLRNPLEKLTGEEARTWLKAQYRDGWRAPSLPAEHGGMGLSRAKQLIYQEELDRYGVARAMDHGLRMVAPVLLRHGSEQQKNYYLPRILACEDVWCQGYSEPNAGSDLANLRTSGRVEGDTLVINGQKIWTSLATDANMIYMLVRTGTGPKKQEGITFVLVPVDTPGIRIRPIRTLAGDEHFCEVFFDEVVVPLENVVGELGQGWSVGKALLGFERYSHGSPELILYALKVFEQTAAAMGELKSETYRELFNRYDCDVRDSTSLYEQVCEAALNGQAADEDFSMLKLFNAELLQRISESATELAGQCGGIVGTAPQLGLPHDLEWLYMITRPVTIFGGTAQVQRNLLATRALKLPKS